MHRSPDQRRNRKPVSRRSPSSHSESDYSDDHRKHASSKKRIRHSDSFDVPPSPSSKRPRYLDRLGSKDENVTSKNQRRSRSASPDEHGRPPNRQQSPSVIDASKKKQEKKIEKKYLKKRQDILEGSLTPTSKDKALRRLEKKKDKKMKKILSGLTSSENTEETQAKVNFVFA